MHRVAVCLLLVLGCDPEDEENASDGVGGTAETGTMMSSGMTSPVGDTGMDDGTSGVSTSPMTTATTLPPGTEDDGGSSTTASWPEGPPCSVQEVTQGELIDPLERGDDSYPEDVAEALEDYCGCHTINSNNQNIKWEYLKAPGGTLFLQYSDLQKGCCGGMSLGDAMAYQVVMSHSMPPGSCYFPPEPDELLSKWFTDGMPTGSTWTPP